MKASDFVSIDPFQIALEKKKQREADANSLPSSIPAPVENKSNLEQIKKSNSLIVNKSNSEQTEKSKTRFVNKSKPLKRDKSKPLKLVGGRVPEDVFEAFCIWCIKNKMTHQDGLAMALDLLTNRKAHDKERARFDDLIDDDYLENNTNHHRVRQFYEDLTGQGWNRSDDLARNEVNHLGDDEIISLMRIIHSRAPAPIANFRYFVTGIKKELAGGSGQQGREVMRKRYQDLARDVGGTYTGAGLSPSELIAHLKARVLREGLAWNNDLANEVMGL